MAVLALALLSPHAASAAFVPTTAPFPAGTHLDDFDAGDARWVAAARVNGERRIVVSGDQGASWQPVADPGDSLYLDVSAAPDGSVWLSGSKTADTDAGGVLHRVPPGSLDPTAVTFSGFGLGGDPNAGHTYTATAPLWDAAGKPWSVVSVTSGGMPSGHLVQLGSDGGPVTHRIPLAAFEASLERLGSQIHVSAGEYLRLDGTTLTGVPAVPKWRNGDRAIDALGRRSYDGGASFHGGTPYTVRAVHDAPDLAISGPSVLSTYAHGLAPTGLTDAPDGWRDAVSTDDGIVLPGDDGIIYLHAGPVPPAPAPTGMQVTRLNTLRAAAGLAPVREDPRLTQASAAHVDYWKLNGFSAHDEFPGSPGFTGASPSNRCMAAGYPEGCAEIAYPEQSTWAMDGWIATPFHGRPMVDPDATDVGGAELAGVGANVNSSLPRAIRFTPAPFPNGSFDGELLAHGESPDPVSACLDLGQDVDWPLGQTIFLHPPTGGTAGVTGLSRVGGAPLAGCRLEGMFLPDEPLAPHTTYRATGVWQGTDDGADQPIQWEFTTGAGHGAGAGGGGGGTTTTTGGSTTRPGGSGLRLGIASMRLPRLAAFARRGLSLSLTCAPACRATVKLSGKLGRKTVTLGKAGPSGLSTRPVVKVKVAKKLRKRVARLRKLVVRIRVSAVPDGGDQALVLPHRITLRR